MARVTKWRLWKNEAQQDTEKMMLCARTTSIMGSSFEQTGVRPCALSKWRRAAIAVPANRIRETETTNGQRRIFAAENINRAGFSPRLPPRVYDIRGMHCNNVRPQWTTRLIISWGGWGGVRTSRNVTAGGRVFLNGGEKKIGKREERFDLGSEEQISLSSEPVTCWQSLVWRNKHTSSNDNKWTGQVTASHKNVRI